jgi:hypothetical protein
MNFTLSFGENKVLQEFNDTVFGVVITCNLLGGYLPTQTSSVITQKTLIQNLNQFQG